MQTFRLKTHHRMAERERERVEKQKQQKKNMRLPFRISQRRRRWGRGVARNRMRLAFDAKMLTMTSFFSFFSAVFLSFSCTTRKWIYFAMPQRNFNGSVRLGSTRPSARGRYSSSFSPTPLCTCLWFLKIGQSLHLRACLLKISLM